METMMNCLSSCIQTVYSVGILLKLVKETSYYIIKTGNLYDTEREILKYLHKRICGLKEAETVEKCDVILVFCPIVSRAGTDIEAAQNRLNTCSESKPAVFVVLHHTFNPEKTVPDSSRLISRSNTLTVNCFFNEDVKLLKCTINHTALNRIALQLKPNQNFFERHVLKRPKLFGAAVLIIGGLILYKQLYKIDE